jgi:hypothetical protein
MFLISALVTVGVTFLIVRRMASQLNQGSAPERRIPSIFLDLPRIVREYNHLLPRSELMLAFWLSLEFFFIWLTCIVFSVAMKL